MSYMFTKLLENMVSSIPEQSQNVILSQLLRITGGEILSDVGMLLMMLFFIKQNFLLIM